MIAGIKMIAGSKFKKYARLGKFQKQGILPCKTMATMYGTATL